MISVNGTAYDGSVETDGATLTITFSKAPEGFHIGDAVTVSEIDDEDIADITYNFRVITAINGNVVTAMLDEQHQPDETIETLKEKLAEIQAQNDMLTECIMEMSEIIYG